VLEILQGLPCPFWWKQLALLIALHQHETIVKSHTIHAQMKEQTSRARLCVHSQHADGGGDGVPDGHANDVGVLQEPADLDLDATCSTKFQSTE